MLRSLYSQYNNDSFRFILSIRITNNGTFINNEFNDVYLVTILEPIPLDGFSLQVNVIITTLIHMQHILALFLYAHFCVLRSIVSSSMHIGSGMHPNRYLRMFHFTTLRISWIGIGGINGEIHWM
jgi:hypothetical protein